MYKCYNIHTCWISIRKGNDLNIIIVANCVAGRQYFSSPLSICNVNKLIDKSNITMLMSLCIFHLQPLIMILVWFFVLSRWNWWHFSYLHRWTLSLQLHFIFDGFWWISRLFYSIVLPHAIFEGFNDGTLQVTSPLRCKDLAWQWWQPIICIIYDIKQYVVFEISVYIIFLMVAVRFLFSPPDVCAYTKHTLQKVWYSSTQHHIYYLATLFMHSSIH